MNATLPPDWKPAAFNPNFDADKEFEEQATQFDHLRSLFNVFHDLTSVSGENIQRAEVTLRRQDLAKIFLLLSDVVTGLNDRNKLMHQHICDKWGSERWQAERELRGEA